MSSTGDKADPEANPATEGEPVDNPEANAAQESKDSDLELVELAYRTGRYEEMANGMKAYIEKHDELGDNEIDAFTDAYKKVIDKRQKELTKLEEIFVTTLPQDQLKVNQEEVSRYRKIIEKELEDWSKEGVTLVDTLIPKAKLPSDKVVYMRLKADFYRYVAQKINEGERNAYVDKALQAYTEAYEFSKAHLNSAHPVHLNVVINFSVFYKTVLKALDKGTAILKETLDLGSTAIKKLEKDDEIDSAMSLFENMRAKYDKWSLEIGGDIYKPPGSKKDNSNGDNLQEDKQETKDGDN